MKQARFWSCLLSGLTLQDTRFHLVLSALSRYSSFFATYRRVITISMIYVIGWWLIKLKLFWFLYSLVKESGLRCQHTTGNSIIISVVLLVNKAFLYLLCRVDYVATIICPIEDTIRVKNRTINSHGYSILIFSSAFDSYRTVQGNHILLDLSLRTSYQWSSPLWPYTVAVGIYKLWVYFQYLISILLLGNTLRNWSIVREVLLILLHLYVFISLRRRLSRDYHCIVLFIVSINRCRNPHDTHSFMNSYKWLVKFFTGQYLTTVLKLLLFYIIFFY